MTTILEVLQQAAPKMAIAIPTSVYGSSAREHVELGQIANDAGEEISREHDWQGLKVLHTLTGDGVTTSWPRPADFMRIPKEQRLWSSAQQEPMTHIASHDEWLELAVRDFDTVTRRWTVLGNEIHIKPAMSPGETAQFYYQSRYFAQSGATPKGSFTADTDIHRIGGRILRLCIVWMWKAAKGLNYEEDFALYQKALEKSVDADKAPRMIAIGRGARPRGAEMSYPRHITP